LAVAPLVGGAVWFAAAWARRVRIRRAALWSEETVRRALGAGRLGPTALAVAAFLGVVALAGPRWGEATIVAETRALSLVIAMDISRSMLAEDASPSRLGRALREGRRLVQDLDGDRVGLLAFAGSSYILSPLSIDGSALTLYLDALDPEVASEGGTGLAGALRQGGELLRASSDLADRVLVVFTDGEAHDTLSAVTEQAQRLHAAGIKLILVAEGGRTPSRIPVRDEHGALLTYQRDDDGRVIQTSRRDDILGAVADAAQGTLVAADLPDQAGAVRDLVASYRRARASEARTEQGKLRAWLPLLCAVALLVTQAITRRTAALIGLALWCLLPPAAPAQQPARPARRCRAGVPRGAAAPAARPRSEVEPRARGAAAARRLEQPEQPTLRGEWRSPERRWRRLEPRARAGRRRRAGRHESGAGGSSVALDRPAGAQDATGPHRPDAPRRRARREGLVMLTLWVLAALQSGPGPDV